MLRSLVALGFWLGCAALPASAQAPNPPSPDPGAPAAAPRRAVTPEHLFRPGNVALTISAGGAAFTDFQRAWAEGDQGSALFERRLSAGTTGAVGADVLWWVARSIGLRLHGSFMPTRFAVKHDEAGEEWLRMRAGTPQTADYPGLRVWLADLSVVIRPRITLGRVAPYAMVGGGVVSYQPVSTRALPPEATTAFQSGPRTSGAAVLGLGAAVPLQRGNLLLSFGLTDHITRSPITELSEPALRRDPRTGLSLDPDSEHGGVRLTSNVRLLVGLTIPLRPR